MKLFRRYWCDETNELSQIDRVQKLTIFDFFSTTEYIIIFCRKKISKGKFSNQESEFFLERNQWIPIVILWCKNNVRDSNLDEKFEHCIFGEMKIAK